MAEYRAALEVYSAAGLKREQVEALHAKLGAVEDRFSEFQAQTEALKALNQEIARGREEATLLDTWEGGLWRAAMRFAFTWREYGLIEGLRSVLRIPVANIIAIMAGRRALSSYVRSLRGVAVRWDKTAHHIHPVQHLARPVA